MLGHHISTIGIQVDHVKILIILKFLFHTTQKYVHKFLGHRGMDMHRKFYQDSITIIPITHKSYEFYWND